MAHHVLCNRHVVVDLAIVYLESQADEVGEDCSGAGFGLDGRCELARFGPHDWETVGDSGLVKGSCFFYKMRVRMIANVMR